MKQVNITEADNIKPIAKPQKSASQFKMLLAMALLSISIIVGACSNPVDPPPPPPPPPTAPTAEGTITYTSGGKLIELPLDTVILERAPGTANGNRFLFITGGISFGDSLASSFTGVAGDGIILGVNLGQSSTTQTYPIDLNFLGDPPIGSGFGTALNWDGVNKAFSPTSSIGSITITLLNDSAIAGTFAFNQTGNSLNKDSVVVNSNVSLNITNGSFEIRFPRFVDTGSVVDTAGAGTVTFTANGRNESIFGSGFLRPLNDSAGTVSGSFLGLSANIDTSNIFNPNINGSLYLMGIGFQYEQGATLPFTKAINTPVIFIDWDGTTSFYPDSSIGSITITALTDTSMAGTFNMIMTGDLTDGNNNVVTPNFTMNITNGRFDVPIRQFIP